MRGASCKGCYFLVFVQLLEKYGALIEINTALIEKVSPCRALLRENERKYVWPKLSKADIASKLADTFTKHDPTRLREVDSLLQQWRGHELGLLQHFQDKYRSTQDDESWRTAALERRATIVADRKLLAGRRLFERVILVRVTEVAQAPPPPPPPKGTILISRTECDALFMDIDKNGDGQLTKEEIKVGLAAIKSATGLAKSAKNIWKEADADASSSVDQDEFFAFMQSAMIQAGKQRVLTEEEKIAEAAENEAAAALEAINRVDCDELFATIDADGDGQLTRKEIAKGLDFIKESTGLIESAKKIFKAAGASIIEA
eukprot:SAG31_NODE_1421_length_8423_cov_2.477054_5_plen_317_part_00